MARPELLRENLVHQIVGCVLDHLDLFEDDALLALDVGGRERRVHHDVAEQIDGERQMLIEDLDVVTGVLLGREGVQLAANRVNRLRDDLGRPAGGALEEHVLDKVGDAAFRIGFVARPASQPDADRGRPDVRHRLGQEPQARRQRLSDYHGRHRGPDPR